MIIRVGQGFDVHRLVANRPLIIGGIHIEHNLGLDGHSDADVLLHAIADALLGACGLGDIGQHFPDTEESNKDANSAQLLSIIKDKVVALGYCIINVDSTLIAQSPKLMPYLPEMREQIAKILCMDAKQINVKAKTNEKLGYLGRGEAIEAQSVVLIMKQS